MLLGLAVLLWESQSAVVHTPLSTLLHVEGGRLGTTAKTGRFERFLPHLRTEGGRLGALPVLARYWPSMATPVHLRSHVTCCVLISTVDCLAAVSRAVHMQCVAGHSTDGICSVSDECCCSALSACLLCSELAKRKSGAPGRIVLDDPIKYPAKDDIGFFGESSGLTHPDTIRE